VMHHSVLLPFRGMEIIWQREGRTECSDCGGINSRLVIVNNKFASVMTVESLMRKELLIVEMSLQFHSQWMGRSLSRLEILAQSICGAFQYFNFLSKLLIKII